jgi:hypothetical protein
MSTFASNTEADSLIAMMSKLQNAFPNGQFASHPVCVSPAFLRFELGGDFENGSEERIRQSVLRASTLYEEIFSATDRITLLVDDFSLSPGESLTEKPADTLSTLIKGYPSSYVMNDCECCISPPTRRLFERAPHEIQHKEIILCIANSEQGRLPRICADVHFMDLERGVAFRMYDDRGCLVLFSSKKLMSDYEDWHTAWRVPEINWEATEDVESNS